MSSRAARLTFVAVALALVATLLVGFWAISSAKDGSPYRRLDRPVPAADFTLPALDREGDDISLSSLRGRFVVLNFWASWCVPCRTEMPALARLAADFDDRGLTVLGVNARGDARSSALAFLDEVGARYPQVVDRDGAVGRRYGTTGLPETFVIDPDGRVIARVIGELSEREIRAFAAEVVGTPGAAG
jgi:cytochrome c biogenesis protein CcmG/thiol:disulfide interchange protein DsbE